MGWFLYDNGLRHERVKKFFKKILNPFQRELWFINSDNRIGKKHQISLNFVDFGKRL